MLRVSIHSPALSGPHSPANLRLLLARMLCEMDLLRCAQAKDTEQQHQCSLTTMQLLL